MDEILFSDIHSEDCINYVWNKAISVEGYDADMFRKDSAGAWIAKDSYGQIDSPFGWQIDHVYPIAKGGQNHGVNLRAMHWSNNISKGDDYPNYRINTTSENNRNISTLQMRTVNETLQNRLSILYNIHS